MAAIGGITVDFLKGGPPETPRAIVELLERSGADGTGARLGPVRSQPVELFATVFSANLTAAKAAEEAIGALQGTVVTIVDEWGTSITDCLVQRARPVGRRAVLLPVTGYPALQQRIRSDVQIVVVRNP